jgi:UDP-N-acetylmuramyl pentapeptide phosphotransferase/UDP-N-acetylglucosamine-1-phosphate transferase
VVTEGIGASIAAWMPLSAFTATLITLWWLIRGPLARVALDHPNERSLHAAPVPRTGGIGIHVGIVLAWMLIAPPLPTAVPAAAALVLAVSLVDDARGLPAFIRLATHLGAASLVAASLLHAGFGLAVTVGVALAIAWMANLYNFMDGSDGLAGGMTAIGFTVYGIAAWWAGSIAFSLLNFSIAAAATAFLIFNFHPARVFMGDAGSVPLGFLAATFGLLGWLQRDWAWWFPVLVFSPFVVDASVTLARRLARRERIWEAHKDHYYQRLVRLGWGHRRTALAAYVLMSACGFAALAGLVLQTAQQMLLLLGAAVAYVLLVAVLERAWRKTFS